MAESITVHVVKYRDRKNLVMRYLCPLTNKQVMRSTGTPWQKEAEKAAAKWEAELREGRYQKPNRMGWQEFVDHWVDSRGSLLKGRTTLSTYLESLSLFERLCRPRTVADLTTPRMTTFANELRKGDRTEGTVAKHLRTMRAVANWACRQELIHKAPVFDMPNPGGMKGRPITGEEFDRMLAATELVVDADAAESWRLLLRGLWWSGLRLGEAKDLRWDAKPGAIWPHLDGEKSALVFSAGSQKSGKEQVAPLAPEAVVLLEALRQDSGFVFNPECRRPVGRRMARDRQAWTKVVSKIGDAAKVITVPETGGTATAHDLRRSFGKRWSRRVMPVQLKELMRHSTIETTMKYYVGLDAADTSASLWAAMPSEGTTLGITGKSKALGGDKQIREGLQKQ